MNFKRIASLFVPVPTLDDPTDEEPVKGKAMVGYSRRGFLGMIAAGPVIVQAPAVKLFQFELVPEVFPIPQKPIFYRNYLAATIVSAFNSQTYIDGEYYERYPPLYDEITLNGDKHEYPNFFDTVGEPR